MHLCGLYNFPHLVTSLFQAQTVENNITNDNKSKQKSQLELFAHRVRETTNETEKKTNHSHYLKQRNQPK